MNHVTSKTDNIEYIKARDLCTGCGFCAAFCPTDAIRITRDQLGFNSPVISESRCTNCGLCLDVCPSHEMQYTSLSKDLTNSFSYDALLGKYIKIYLGCACNKNLRFRASSGGFVTSLLYFMLKKQLINGAIVAVMSKKRPLLANAIVARSWGEVKEAMGSKYTPVSMDKALKDLMASEGNYAFVGLPCHIEALRAAEKRFTKLKEKILIRIGLYCNNVPSVSATKYVLWYFKAPQKKISNIKYRGQGWPGFMTIKFEDGTKIKIPFRKYWSSGFGQFFCKIRCIICSDHTAERADLSVADPIPELLSREQIGRSLIVVRSQLGMEILREARQAGFVALRESGTEMAIQSATIFKKGNKSSRGLKILLGEVPPYEYTLPLTFHVIWILMRYRFYSSISRRQELWPLMKLFLSFERKIHSFLAFIFKRRLKKDIRS